MEVNNSKTKTNNGLKALIGWLFLSLTGILILIIAAAALWPYKKMNNDVDTGIAYAAKLICSGLYVQNRSLDDLIIQDLRPINPVFERLTIKPRPKSQSVRVSLMGLRAREAFYTQGQGCTLKGTQSLKPRQALATMPRAQVDAVWPLGEITKPSPLSGRTMNALSLAIEKSFERNKGEIRDTRAVLVVYKGQLIAEHYAQGFNKNSLFLGWSMSKSVTSALIGTLVDDKILSLDQTVLMGQWTDVSGPKNVAKQSPVRLDHLLKMQSGQKFNEDYGIDSDVVRLLFAEGAMADYTISQPLIHEPGSHFNYNTGTSMVLAKLAQDTIGSEDLINYARRTLFEPAGMRSVVFETDASNYLAGGSYLYATGRDWARFGLLYEQDGKINDQKILSKQWVDYARTPNAKNSEYGAHWWLNSGPTTFGKKSNQVAYPRLPRSLYYAGGHNGQRIAIFPDQDLVIVRLGWTGESKSAGTNTLFEDIFQALGFPLLAPQPLN